jgi:hypothetical protein
MLKAAAIGSAAKPTEGGMVFAKMDRTILA